MSASIKEIIKPSQPNNGEKAEKLYQGKYDISQLSYPTDLMGETYGGNYVMFYINVATESRLFKVNDTKYVLDPSVEKRDRGDLIAKPSSTNQLTGSAAVLNTLTGVAGGAILGKGLKGAVKGVALANLPTVGVAVAGTQAPDASRSQRRLKTAIALHIPNTLSVRYGMQWSDDDTVNMAAASQASDDIIRALDKPSKSNAQGIGNTAADIVTNKTLSSAPNAGAISARLGIAANPKKEQVFKGVDFRTFQFEYQFFPRSEKEAENVLNIIYEFKLHMHPEFKDANNFVYIYPSEFDIIYYNNGAENRNLHRHTSCVLTEMNVNYTPNGSFSAFRNGIPTQINVTLSFRELALLSKEKIQTGL
jgi:hypothetical protein